MASNSSLTPLVVFLKIEREGSTVADTSDEGTKIFVSAVRYVLGVNNVSEAVVDIAYKDQEGKDLIDEIFPRNNDGGTYLSQATLTLKGFDTKYSTIKQDIEIFKGTIIGQGQSFAVGNSTYRINLRGALFQLNQVPVLSPGLHGSTTNAFGVAPLFINSSSGKGVIDQIIKQVDLRDNGFRTMQAFLENYEEAIGQSSASNIFRGNAFEVALKAFRLPDGAASVLKDEFAQLDIPDEAGIKIDVDSDIKKSLAQNIITKYAANFRLTWWNVLMEITEQYGLDIIYFGSKIYGVARCPLSSPPDDLNNILAEDLVNINTDDFPFFAPTRCLLLTKNYFGTFGPNRRDHDVSFFPDTNELTPQEIATGVFTTVQYAPGLLGYIGVKQGKAYNNSTNHDKMSVVQNGKDKVKETAEQLKQETEQGKNSINDFYEKYAAYILMKKKFSQRAGFVATRFKPDIVPGLPCKVNSPAQSANFDCYVLSVENVINCLSNQAYTNVTVNNIRYGGELSPNPFNNPIYPNFSIPTVTAKIKSDFPGIF